MVPIDDVIKYYQKQYALNPIETTKVLLASVTQVKECWYMEHMLTEDDSHDYPSFIHTHGLLYRFPRELEVDLRNLPTDIRRKGAEAFILAITDSLFSDHLIYDAMLDNKYFTGKFLRNRVDSDDGLVMYDNEPYETAVYEITLKKPI